MIRMVVLFLGGIIAITLLRMVMGLIGKAVGDLVNQPSPGAPAPTPAAATGGQLKKCASCGIHAVPHKTRGESHYCSAECAAKA